MTRSAAKLDMPRVPPRPTTRPPVRSETRLRVLDIESPTVDPLDIESPTADDLDLESPTATCWPPPRPTGPPSVRVPARTPHPLPPPAIVAPAEQPPAFSIVVLDSSRPVDDGIWVDLESLGPDLPAGRARTGKVIAGVTLTAVAVLGIAELILALGLVSALG